MNTVAEAQEVYRHLQNEPSLQDCPIYLFHSRFTMERRLEIERELLALFGKHGTRPGRAIVVATQVIEQSLDLDFDVMISDLAPIDLLFQRAGRMHRHDRGARLHARTLHLLLPDLSGQQVNFGRSTFIYHSDILLLTAFLFANEDGDPKHQDVELPYSLSAWIEAVYGNPPQPVPERLQKHLEKLQLEREGKDLGSSFAARVGTLEDSFLAEADPEYLVDLSNDNDDDLLTHSTREGRDSVSLIIANEGESLECHGKQHAEALYSRVLNSDHPAVVRCFQDSEPPESWHHFALLRYCRPLIFRNRKDTFGLGLHYDDEIGLQFPQSKRGS
jgi:CRISPR-associated endonuclease/helicase Cas3